MADKFFVVKTNLPEVRGELLRFAGDVAPKILRGATSAAASVFKKLAIANAPHRSGRLKRAIYMVRIREQSGRGAEVYRIGVRSGKKQQKADRDAFYWRWVEAGYWRRAPGANLRRGLHTIRLQRARDKVSGRATRVEGQEYLGRAFREGNQAALKRFYDVVESRIKRENKKR